MYIFALFILFFARIRKILKENGSDEGKRNGSKTSPEDIIFSIKLCLLNYAITLKYFKIIKIVLL